MELHFHFHDCHLPAGLVAAAERFMSKLIDDLAGLQATADTLKASFDDLRTQVEELTGQVGDGSPEVQAAVAKLRETLEGVTAPANEPGPAIDPGTEVPAV